MMRSYHNHYLWFCIVALSRIHRTYSFILAPGRHINGHDVRVAYSQRKEDCMNRLFAGTNVVNHDKESSDDRKFMYMTKEQDQELKEKGDIEARLMRVPTKLKTTKIRAGPSSGKKGGFGGGNRNKANQKEQRNKRQGDGQKSDWQAQAEGLSKVLKTDGIVRIDNVLAPELCDELRDYLVDLRSRATLEVERGDVLDSQERFADVLLNQNRCDLKIPLGPEPVNKALYHLLSQSCVRPLIERVYDEYGGMGNLATLYELNCFMSNSGARRQLVHADNVCLEPVQGLTSGEEPVMLTCFVALQDVGETDGPTVWMPGTNTIDFHNQFFETGINDDCQVGAKDRILQSSKSLMGTLPKGSCAIFDPRVLHCAGANVCSDPTKTRALFYVSFKNPKIDYPGSPSTCGYGISTAELTMQDLCSELKNKLQGLPALRLETLSCFP